MSKSKSTSKKILLVHRYYWPDVPAYAQMLHIMAKSFSEAGYDVSVFSTQPSYNNVYKGPTLPGQQVVDGVKIFRIKLWKEDKSRVAIRALNVMRFCMCLLLHTIRHRYSLMMVGSFPPTVMGFVARCIRRLRGTPYIYHCQDLYPEVAQASGLTQPGRLARIAASVDRKNCERAARVVVLSEDMRQTIAARKVDIGHVRIINNFVIDRFQPVASPQATRLAPEKFQVIFAGNMGRFQGLEHLIQAAQELNDETDIEFVFVGGGVLTDKLKKLAGGLLGKSVHFIEHQPLENVMQMTHDANLSVVSLGAGVIRCAYPSKTMSYLESGARLLVIMESDCELVRFVQTHDLGATCSEANPAAIAKVIRQEFQRSKSNAPDSARVQKIAQEHFGQPVVLSKWLTMFGEVCPLDTKLAPQNNRPQLEAINSR